MENELHRIVNMKQQGPQECEEYINEVNERKGFYNDMDSDSFESRSWNSPTNRTPHQFTTRFKERGC